MPEDVVDGPGPEMTPKPPSYAVFAMWILGFAAIGFGAVVIGGG